VHIRPQEQLTAAFNQKMALSEERRARFAAIRDLPAETKDGARIDLMMNAGLLYDLPHVADMGADGIGLFRTELQFMISRTFPRLATQTELYKEVLDTTGDKPVTFRTLDLGGDKILPYLEAAEEENPAMGWRAVRFALDRPGLLRYQLRAMMAAAARRELRLMFPMVSEVDEFLRARDLVDRELEWRRDHGRPLPTSVKVGSMLEVPSLAWQLNALLPRVDFLSVGTNDLLQFLFAADRSNARVADRYDFLSPAVLSFIRHVTERATAFGVPVTVCGEAAGRPLEALALLGVGVRALSVPASSIAPIKMMVRGLHLGALEPVVGSLLERPDRSVRDELTAFAEESGLTV
jgi:phosphotransferase system enzyme I (PtsP)